MDHHFWVDGRAERLKGDLVKANLKEDDLAFWIQKHVRYAALHAGEELLRRNGQAPWVVRPALFGSPDKRVAWLKKRWYFLSLYVRPFLCFAYRYVLRLGFLDGKQRFIFHFLHALWHRLLVAIALDDLRSDVGSKTGSAGR